MEHTTTNRTFTAAAIAFVAGGASVAAAAIAAGGRPAIVGFILGSTAVVSLAGLTLRFVGFARTARFLAAIGTALESDATVGVKPATAARPELVGQLELTGMGADVASALQNQGAKKKTAESAARYAIAQLPAGEFVDVYRVALQGLNGKAAA